MKEYRPLQVVVGFYLLTVELLSFPFATIQVYFGKIKGLLKRQEK
jgi:hypothetical protein